MLSELHFNLKNKNYFLFAVFGVIIFTLFLVYFLNGLRPLNSDKTFALKIRKGEGVKEIAASLSRAGLIRSISTFKIYVLLTGQLQNLKPGLYQINGRMRVPEIVNLLVEGQKEINIAIIEGMTLKEIDRVLASVGIISDNELINLDFKKDAILMDKFPFLKEVDSLEGFLYTDTYRFHAESLVEEVVEKIIDNFQKEIWPLIKDKKNWYEILITASILEKEVPNFQDRQLVAGILDKRIKKGLPLQVDAALVYAKCQGDLLTCRELQLSKNDLKIESPYNTYLNLGLPPVPISNFNKNTVEAVLNQKTSNYLYYLSTKDKKTIFSKTLEEHNLNRQIYLK